MHFVHIKINIVVNKLDCKRMYLIKMGSGSGKRFINVKQETFINAHINLKISLRKLFKTISSIKLIIIFYSLFFQLQVVSCNSMEGIGNLVLRYSVSHFPPNSGGIKCWVTDPNVALCLDTRTKKRKYTFK